MGYARDLYSASCSSHGLQDNDSTEVPNRRRLPFVHLGKSDSAKYFTDHGMLTPHQVGATAYSAMMQLAYHNGFGRHSRE
jgi:hypothetical protein